MEAIFHDFDLCPEQSSGGRGTVSEVFGYYYGYIASRYWRA